MELTREVLVLFLRVLCVVPPHHVAVTLHIVELFLYIQGSYRTWKVREFYCSEFQAWKVLEKGIGPGKPWKFLESPGILKQSFWISVQVADKSGSSCWTCWPNLGSLEYNNTTSGIAFPLLYFNADTLITDFVYALFDLVQPMFWMERFLESPGKKHLNFCTNPVYHVYYHCYCCCKAFREHLPRLEVV